jgi:hypothetical protein
MSNVLEFDRPLLQSIKIGTVCKSAETITLNDKKSVGTIFAENIYRRTRSEETTPLKKTMEIPGTS